MEIKKEGAKAPSFSLHFFTLDFVFVLQFLQFWRFEKGWGRIKTMQKNMKKPRKTVVFRGFCLVHHQGLEPGTP